MIRRLINAEGWAALVEALRLLPPLALLHDILHLHDPLRLHEAGASGFRSFVVSPQWTSPRNLMLEGRRQDLQSVFNALPVGSRWDLLYPDPNHMVYYVLKETEEDWARLELYLDTEDMK